MKRSAEEAGRIARLAAFELCSKDRDAMAGHLERILAFVEKLNELDTDGVEPLTQPHGEISIFRPDTPQPSLPPAQALQNAPDRLDDRFRLPRVVG